MTNGSISQEIADAYERGIRDGYERAARALADPQMNWSDAWRPAVYRCWLVLMMRAYPGRQWDGDMPKDFGREKR